MYRYNNERRHGGIKYLTPIQKLSLVSSSSEAYLNQSLKEIKLFNNKDRINKQINNFEELPVHFVTELVG